MKKLLLILFIILFPISAWCADLYVGPGQTYTTFTAALQAVTGNDTIHIVGDTTEPDSAQAVTFSGYTVTAQFEAAATITFQASTSVFIHGTGSLIIKDSTTGEYPKRGVMDFSAATAQPALGEYISSTTVPIEFDDLEIIGPTGNYYVLLSEVGGMTFNRCYIHDFSGSTNYGIVRAASTTGSITIESCYIVDVNPGSSIIQYNQGGTLTFINNTVYNSGSSGYVYIWGDTTNDPTWIVKNNVFISGGSITTNMSPMRVNGIWTSDVFNGTLSASNNFFWKTATLSSPRAAFNYAYVTMSHNNNGDSLVGSSAADAVPITIDPDISSPATSPEIGTTSLLIGRAVSAGQTMGYNGVTYQNDEAGCWALSGSYSEQYISTNKNIVMVTGDSFCNGTNDFDEYLKAQSALSGKTFVVGPGETTDGVCISGAQLISIFGMTTEQLQVNGPGTIVNVDGYNDYNCATTAYCQKSGKFIAKLVENLRTAVEDLTNNKVAFIYSGAPPDRGCYNSSDCSANADTTQADAAESYLSSNCPDCVCTDVAANFTADSWNDGSGNYYYFDPADCTGSLTPNNCCTGVGTGTNCFVHPDDYGNTKMAELAATAFTPLWNSYFGSHGKNLGKNFWFFHMGGE